MPRGASVQSPPRTGDVKTGLFSHLFVFDIVFFQATLALLFRLRV